MKQIISISWFLMITNLLLAQVGIGTVTPSLASNLEVSSQVNYTGNFRGFMPPRVPDVAARDAIDALYSDYGLLVFVTSNGSLQIWDGDSWETIISIAVASPSAWINEFHYDNISDDEGEFIEIAGPAGLDLNTYSVVLYNGSNGQSYSTSISYTGVIISDQLNGFGTVSKYVDNIQNGDPVDGFALVNSGSVIQFLSYEGTFMATNGPANGMMSTDINFSESNNTTPVGFSLGLSGSGVQYNQFVWNPPATATPGEVNTGQSF